MFTTYSLTTEIEFHNLGSDSVSVKRLTFVLHDMA